MIIVKFKGGLGNQMFQYTLYKWFELHGMEVKADLNFYEQGKARYQLKNIFEIELCEASKDEIRKYGDFSLNILARVRRKFFGWKISYLIEDESVFYSFKDRDNLYLDGYWQNAKYFKEIEKEIRYIFSHNTSMNEYQRVQLQKITETEAVSVHVRRGDYLSAENVEMYGNICTEKYYHSAIEYVIQKCAAKDFYIFSDDTEWARENFRSTESIRFHVIDSTDDKDMFLMAACKYNIIANSSYSWWAAWLNKHENKVVVAPSIWVNTSKIRGIYCDEWVLCSPNGTILDMTEV